MPERRYSEEEVAAIFEQAAEAQQATRRHLPPGEGMTLANLQEIGREVGIPAELVTQAARSLDGGAAAPQRQLLGVPISAARTVELGRRLTEDDWNRLVVDLRQTFDARGNVRVDGAFRQWTNGNLQVLVEPGDGGDRIRMRTINANLQGALIGGVGAAVGSGVIVGMSILTQGGVDPKAWLGIGLMSVVGLGLFAFGALRLRVWARLRKRQMDGIAARLTMLSTPLPGVEQGQLPK